MLVHCPDMEGIGAGRRPLPPGISVDKGRYGGGEARGIGRFIPHTLSLAKLIRCAAHIWHDQRKAAGPRFGGDHAKGFGLTSVDERVGAGEQPCQPFPVRDCLSQANVRIVADGAQQFRFIPAAAQQQKTDRPFIAGGGDRLDYHWPAFFCCQPSEADQKGCIRIKAALGEHVGAKGFVTKAW